MKHEEEFLKHLLDVAKHKRENAGFAGTMGDGGASDIERDILTYNAGIEGTVPEQWATMYKEFCNTRDPRYQDYLKLKAEFES